MGLEPTRCHHHRILNPARLPFRHPGNGLSLYKRLHSIAKTYDKSQTLHVFICSNREIMRVPAFAIVMPLYSQSLCKIGIICLLQYFVKILLLHHVINALEFDYTSKLKKSSSNFCTIKKNQLLN